MIANFTNFLSTMDKSSQFLLMLIFIIVFLLILIFIINSLNAKRAKKYNRLQTEYKRKLREEIDKEAKSIVTTQIEAKKAIKEPVEEDIEVLDDSKDDIDVMIDELKDNNTSYGFSLTDFEKEQEETAVISYEELCKKHGVEQKIYNKEEKNIIEKVSDIVENKKTTFKPTQYVSPIFGLQQEEAKDQAFLTNLKEFRNGLE